MPGTHGIPKGSADPCVFTRQRKIAISSRRLDTALLCAAKKRGVELPGWQVSARITLVPGPRDQFKNPPWRSSMKTVTIYTDGACSGNPGPGGWCAILQYGANEKQLSGGEANTTNNRMELTAVIEALRALKAPCRVELWSDSKYVIDALEKGWARGWQKRGWVKSDKKPALNPDLWQTLLSLCDTHDVHCHWVKGHAENEYNNRCDQQAVLESQKFK